MSTNVEGEDGGHVPSTSTSNPQSPARTRRRARKRNGPPQLQFLTATDPSQFKDESVKRSVRSQAMIQYRYQESEQKHKTKDAHAPRSTRKDEKAPVKQDRLTPVLLNDNARVYQSAQDAFLTQWLEEPQEPVYGTTSEAWWSANPNASNLARERSFTSTSGWGVGGLSLVPYATPPVPMQSSGYGNRVIRYEDTDAHDEELLRIIVATVKSSQRMGNGMDPFVVIPQFKCPELNAVRLVRNCNRAFSSKSTLEKWLPVMLSDPHILLSSTLMATTWLDMHAGVCGESKRTVLLKQEAISYINERLRDSRAMEDSTLAVIIHVLAGEMWSCNEKTLRIHEEGVARLIAHRGGMSQLGGYGVVAQVAAAVTSHCDLICEATPLPIFYQWEPPNFAVDEMVAVPESPLYCPRGEFVTARQDRGCSEITHELLCDMRDLTDLFIAHNAAFDTVLDVETYPHDAQHGPSLVEYEARLAEFRAKLASLPSAHVLGLPTTHDWVYESCRIAAIIYASAVIMRVPLSAAADPGRNIIMRDIASLTGSFAGEEVFAPRLTETLYEVIEHTNIGDLWNNMSGVFYWVNTVGAAAARTSVNIDFYERPTCANDAYATWVRRCLIMFATRAMILILFEHPLPLIMAEKKLLKVQELLGSGSSRRLIS
ncbi:hypothetical protein K458DRAFT_385057 [Lentithecium fluviatile CBS 122367]|uniref:Transcription factor domain-containing protein n=1 Tax=Lentithecium fluviatile CBS 122367 TaxID=1168545 RepID=A0A6G1JFH8_9PLEO|nr:hypothetical protein K458DRAFT_385057 [Lentithecium fluviatile CBS 122367]